MKALLKLAAIASILAIAATPPVQAQTTGGYLLPSSTGGTLTVNTGLGGWSFTISSCGETYNSVANSSCSTAEVIPTVLQGTLSLVFLSSSGGALEASAAGFSNDIALTVSVTGPVTGIQSSSFAIAGTVATQSANDLSRVSGGDTTTYNGTSSVNQLVGLAGPTLSSATFAPITTTATSVIDIRAQGTGVHGNSPATLSSMTLTYNAPEPVSSSLLAVGLAGVGFVRRKLRRPI